MPSFRITVDQVERFEAPKLSAAQVRAVGAAIVETIHRRVASFRNVNDQPAKPYSSRGPIYVPVSGVGTVIRAPGFLVESLGRRAANRRIAGEIAAGRLRAETFTEKRTKSTLGGREVLTGKDIAKMRSLGVIAGGRGRPGVTPLGSVTPSGKSVKFANYAAYKRALGKSGERDLELSGRMLGSIGIVDMTGQSVTVGFLREGEQLKAMGNQARDPWFGISPADRRYIEGIIAGFLTA